MTTSARDARLGNPDWVDNWTIGPGLRMEIMDEETSDVWLAQEPIDEARARSSSLPPGFVLSGLAYAVADLGWFARSPGAEVDGPLTTMEVDGRRFARVARPVERDRTVADGIVMWIHKYHSMLFRAGRTIDVVELDDGRAMVPAWAPVGGPMDRREPRLPVGWTHRSVELGDDLLVEIPNPATVLVAHDGSGFHGPVQLGQLGAVDER